MKRKDRFTTKDSLFYALVIFATFAVTGSSALIGLVEHSGAFTDHERTIYVAKVGDRK